MLGSESLPMQILAVDENDIDLGGLEIEFDDNAFDSLNIGIGYRKITYMMTLD